MRNFRSKAFAPAAALAVEAEAVDGKVTQEIEYMFYAKVDSPETLLNALCVEIQEQWGLWTDKTDKNAGSGSNRVRKTITKQIVAGEFDNDHAVTQYVMTTKIKRADGSSLEIPNESSEDGLKAFRLLAESGMIKHRYRFPVAGSPRQPITPGGGQPVQFGEHELHWEVDMFIVPGESMYSTNYIGWAKIDLEVPHKDYPIPELPAGFSNAFDSKVENPTPEQAEIIEKMQQYLNLPNPHVKEVYKDVV